MIAANHALQVFVPLLYFAACVAYRRSGATGEGSRGVPPYAIAVAAFLAHAALTAVRGAILGQMPWTTVYDGLSALALLMTLTYLVIELVTRDASTGRDLLPWPFVLTTIACAFGPDLPRPDPALASPLFLMHTLPALGGTAAILVSGIYGMLYLRLERAMRAKRFDGIFRRLPDLEGLARMNFLAVVVGFVLVTAAIGWGATWYGDMFERVDVTEPKIAFTLVIWTLLLLPIGGRLLRRWSDRQTAMVSLVSMSLAVLSILATMLPFVSFHGHY